ncbi:MAG: HdeD family acid-resistance protein [Lachnospiraceae bacterium]
MRILKELKWQSILYAALYIVLGVILLLFPETTATTLCYAVGGAAIVIGVVSVCIYLFRDVSRNTYRNDFVSGLVSILLGIFIFYKVDLIISLIPFVLGIAVVVSGFLKLQDCIDVRRMGYGNGLALFILAIINVALGIVLVLNPFSTAILLFRIIGIGLIFSGISDLVTTLYMSKKIKNYVDDMKVLNGVEDEIP